MLLLINPAKTVLQMQEEFREAFPFLKLQFFLHPTEWQTGPPLKSSLVIETAAIQNGSAEGIIDIHPEMTVKELVHILQTRFFLDAQVYRKAGRAWLGTIAEDYCTLATLNERGFRSTLAVAKPEGIAC